VQVAWSPATAYSHQTETFSSGGVAGAYTWGTSADDFNMYNTTTPYTVTFTFVGPAPDPTKLLLVIAGLDNVTTATVSQAGSLVGEASFPIGSLTTSTTCLGTAVDSTKCPSTGTVFYSDYNRNPAGHDFRNTGWALFQTGPIDLVASIPTLTVAFNQDSGDGIGVTLGYVNVPSGYIEVCKASSTTNPVPANGIYSFTVSGSAFSTSTNPLKVPVGECSGPIAVTPPSATITELPVSGVGVSAISAYGYSSLASSETSLLESSNLQTGTAVVMVVPPATAGSTSTETIVTFTNQAVPPAVLKICKVAGSGVSVNASFNFTLTPPATTLAVEAGPLTEGGYCAVVPGTFQVGTSVTVAETVPSGYAAPVITVNGTNTPSAGCTPTPYCVVAAIGPGVNEVSFTNSCVGANGVPCPLPGVPGNALPALDIVNYSFVSQVPAAGTQSYVTYRADLLNAGTTNLGPMIATLASLDPSGVQVVGRAALNFAAAPPNSQVTSSNTFTILTDPTVPLDFSKLNWTFQSSRSVQPKR
jgi:hypothetical protein